MEEDQTRHFVRLVAGLGSLTFEGEKTTWEQLPELLEKVPNKAFTVLELAIESDRLTIAQLNDAQARAGILSRNAGFEYLSYIGVQPLGSRGSPGSPRRTGNPGTLLQKARNDGEAYKLALLAQAASQSEKASTGMTPRDVVQRWLELVKAGKASESWQWIVPKSKSVLGPEEIHPLNNRAQIEPKRSLGSDEAAMVVTSRFKDNSDREQVAYFYLRRQGGRWLIRRKRTGFASVIQLGEDFFQLGYGDGRRTGFHRHKEATKPPMAK